MSRTPSTYRPRSAPTTSANSASGAARRTAASGRSGSRTTSISAALKPHRERVLPAWTKEMTELQYQDWLQGRYDPWPSS